MKKQNHNKRKRTSKQQPNHFQLARKDDDEFSTF